MYDPSAFQQHGHPMAQYDTSIPVQFTSQSVYASELISQPSSSSMVLNPNTSNSAIPANFNSATDLASNDDDVENISKRRRVQRACDTCRKKKVRCDGLQQDKGACSNCSNNGYECTFADATRKRLPPRSYVEALEARMSKMEELLAQLAPGVDFSDKLGKPISRPDDGRGDGENTHNAQTLTAGGDETENALFNFQSDRSVCMRGFGELLKSQQTRTASNSHPDGNVIDESDDEIAFIETGFARTSLSSSNEPAQLLPERPVFGGLEKTSPAWGISPDLPIHDKVHKFLGKASDIHLIPLLERISKVDRADLGFFPKGPRTKFWRFPTAFLDPPPDLSHVMAYWPPDDLAETLIHAFFGRTNHDLPILNEAQFRHEFYHQPDLRNDHEWVSLAFSVFLVASNYVQDPRVLEDPTNEFSRGLLYYKIIKMISHRHNSIRKPIRHIQSMLLTILYQVGTHSFVATPLWIMLGLAIRLLYDHGAHRKMSARKLGLSRLEEENYKRAFWVAYSLDRILSAGLGRPFAIQDEDIDIDLPLEVDDEIIFNAPEDGPIPEQPKDKPALISGFISGLRLDELVGKTLRTIYATPKTKARFGFMGSKWDELVVTEIDSALNKWLDTVPEHLRYDPHQKNDEWLVQSSALYSKYYFCQVLVHRPYISSRKSSSALNFPSLAICTNAARSFSHLFGILKHRNLQQLMGAPMAFQASTFGSILLMVIWGAKSSGGRVSSSAMNDLRRLIEVLRSMEKHWRICGMFVDVYESLIAAFELPRPTHVFEQGTKRTRNDQGSEAPRQNDSIRSDARNSPVDIDKDGSAKTDKRKIAEKNTLTNDTPSRTFSRGYFEQEGTQTPRINQLPLSTYQLAYCSVSPAQSSPSSKLGQLQFGENDVPFGSSSVSQAFGTESLPSWNFSASGGPYLQGQGQGQTSPPATFGMINSISLGWNPSSGPNVLNSNLAPEFSANSSKGQLSGPPLSIFDEISFDLQAMSGPTIDGFGQPQPIDLNGLDPSANIDVKGQSTLTGGAQVENDSSHLVANYAFDLLQKQGLWGLGEDHLEFLQQQMKQVQDSRANI